MAARGSTGFHADDSSPILFASLEGRQVSGGRAIGRSAPSSPGRPSHCARGFSAARPWAEQQRRPRCRRPGRSVAHRCANAASHGPRADADGRSRVSGPAADPSAYWEAPRTESGPAATPQHHRSQRYRQTARRYRRPGRRDACAHRPGCRLPKPTASGRASGAASACRSRSGYARRAATHSTPKRPARSATPRKPTAGPRSRR